MPAHVRKGDTVMVTSGSHKGQMGEILQVIPKKDQVIVRGINLRTKHVKPSQRNPQGGVITREEPLHISKVSPVVDGKPVRVGFRTKDDGTKVRVARHGGKDIKELGVIRGSGDSKPAAKKTSKAKSTKSA